MVAKPAASGSASVKVTTPTVKPAVKVTTPTVKPTVKVNVKPAVKVTTPTVKPTVKVTVPKVTVPKANIKVTVKSSTVAIVTAATATSWTAWTAQTRSSAFTSPAFASNECLANAAMKLFTWAVVFGQSTATMETMAMKWWKALDTAFKLAGSETVVTAWTSFKGTSINTSATAKVTIKVKAPASAAAKVTVPKVSLKVGASTKRRLQAPVAPVKPVAPVVPAVQGGKFFTQGTSGVALSVNYSPKSSGFAVPAGMEKGADQVQMASAKIFGFAIFAAIAMLFIN